MKMSYWGMAKPRPSDPMQLAKSVADEAIARAESPAISEQLRVYMRALGKIGGKKGGERRAQVLSKNRRKEIAQAAAKARWGKKHP